MWNFESAWLNQYFVNFFLLDCLLLLNYRNTFYVVCMSPWLLWICVYIHWRRKWQPTPVFLPGESQGWRSLVGCHLRGRTESHTTEVTYLSNIFSHCIICLLNLFIVEQLMLLKNWCFWTVVSEKTLQSSLDNKEIHPVHSEGDQPWDSFGGNDAEAETPILWPSHAKSWLIGKDSDAGWDWGQEEMRTTEEEMAGWHHCLNGRESEWTPGVVMDREAWRAAIHAVAKSRTRLTDWNELNWIVEQDWSNLACVHMAYLTNRISYFYCNLSYWFLTFIYLVIFLSSGRKFHLHQRHGYVTVCCYGPSVCIPPNNRLNS